MRSRGSVLVAGVLAAAVVGMAAPAQAAPGYPGAEGRCVDQTGVLGETLCKKVTAILLRDEKATSDEIAVAVVPTTGDKSIEAYSTGLFNSWGVGKKDKNNGVLLVVAIDDHRVRVETGRGAAGRLTDDDAQRIIDDVITPPFTDEDYPRGILSGLDEVRRELGHKVPATAMLKSLAPAVAAPETTSSDTYFAAGGGDAESHDSSPVPVAVIAVGGLLLIGLFVLFISRVATGTGTAGTRPRHGSRSSSAHHTTWMAGSSDSGSSSGSGFGGGSSDGSGASGSW